MSGDLEIWNFILTEIVRYIYVQFMYGIRKVCFDSRQ